MERGRGPLQRFTPFLDLGVDPLELCQRPLGRRERAQDAALVRFEEHGEAIGEPGKLFYVIQSLGLDLQRFVFTDFWSRRGDLVHDVLEVVGTFGDLIPSPPEIRLLLAQPRAGLERPPDFGAGVDGAREGIQYVALGRGAKERLGLVLPVQIHQQRTQTPEHRHGRWGPVGPRAVTALRTDLPTHHQRSVADVEPDVVRGAGQLAEGSHIERRFDHRPFRPGTHPVRARPLAQQKRQRVDHHGLARPGFASQDVETRFQGNGDVGDDGEVSDAKLGKHVRVVRGRSDRPTVASAADGQRTLPFRDVSNERRLALGVPAPGGGTRASSPPGHRRKPARHPSTAGPPR